MKDDDFLASATRASASLDLPRREDGRIDAGAALKQLNGPRWEAMKEHQELGLKTRLRERDRAAKAALEKAKGKKRKAAEIFKDVADKAKRKFKKDEHQKPRIGHSKAASEDGEKTLNAQRAVESHDWLG